MLNKRRLEAVRMRLDGLTVAEVGKRTGLSPPTVSSAWKAFREAGWEGVLVRPRGRKAGQTERLDAPAQEWLVELLLSQPPGEEPLWSSRALASALAAEGHSVSPRAIEHWMVARDLKPEPLALDAMEGKRSRLGRWHRQQVKPVRERMYKAEGSMWQGGARVAKPAAGSPDLPRYQLYLHGKRGVHFTRCFTVPPRVDDYLALFQRLLDHNAGKPVALVFHGAYFQAATEIGAWLSEHQDFHLLNMPTDSD